ncbi:MAG TPA: carbamoyltransferase HypF [Candidatus Dormibacteraeota bacterium]
MAIRRRFIVRGVVQGVGFRPFVWNLAQRLELSGWVQNTSGAVIVEAEGAPLALDSFALALLSGAPRLARVEGVEASDCAAAGDLGFQIVDSRAVAGEYQPIAPDAATCPECVADILNPSDRRYRYPFTNCTNCGPRFTIIEDVPYDRPMTTMRRFTMCAACRAEYEDPSDRRFHAQPIACPTCGPRQWFADADGTELAGDAIAHTAAAVARGAIVAVKGLGGFQLCCDARNDEAVRALRARKHRPVKPFAVMYADLSGVRRIAALSDTEAALLEGSTRPIVLLHRRPGGEGDIAASVAPFLDELGVMLPYTPLHHLLLAAAGGPLVMTSGNVSDEPIAKDNDEAVQRLGRVCDAFLLHNRDIYARYDDSVVRVVAGSVRTVRRARGLCPVPVRVRTGQTQVLALGAHLKNTFTVLKDENAFTGPHIGDLDHPVTLAHHEEALGTYLRLFRSNPDIVAADLHPDYASTRLAETWWVRGAHEVRVQHHHAHIASVLAEHDLRGAVIGVAFDGVGLGSDQTIWGGEFLLADERSFRRIGHITQVRQPGGDACAREGWRMAIAYLAAADRLGELPPASITASPDCPTDRQWRLVSRIARAESAAAPRSTSAGRLFDAVASLLGVAQVSTFEGEAAMRLESLAAAAGEVAEADVVPVAAGGNPLVLDTVQLVAGLVRQRERGRPCAELAAIFHESLARAISAACVRLGCSLGVDRVALSGGVFQNALLLARVETLLAGRDLTVYANHEVPANDGGISLGQALVASSLVLEVA